METKLFLNNRGDGNYFLDERTDTSASVIASLNYADCFEHKLSLKNCQTIERGYDLEELAGMEYFDECDDYESIEIYTKIFKKGFQKALELMGDKKFSERDLDKAIEWGITNGRKGKITHYNIDEFIQSLQQKEWEVEILTKTIKDKQPKAIETIKGISDTIKDISGRDCDVKVYTSFPKLDANGCLILKRKQC